MTMRRFAQDTEVSVQKSEAEIKSLLIRYGATAFMSGGNATGAMIAFEMVARKIVFRMELPNRADEQFTHYTHSSGKMVPRSVEKANEQWEQACRSRWRALALAIKAKLEAVAVGITTFEEEFLAHIVLHDGLTVGQHVRPRIAEYYDSGKVTPLLEGPKS